MKKKWRLIRVIPSRTVRRLLRSSQHAAAQYAAEHAQRHAKENPRGHPAESVDRLSGQDADGHRRDCVQQKSTL